MGEKEMGDIALDLWELFFLKEGLHCESVEALKKRIGNAAKATGIPADKIKIFLSYLLTRLGNKITADVNPRYLKDQTPRDYRQN